jgi:hypothetical protein
MADDNNVKKIKRWKPLSKRPNGRPKIRWEDDVLEDIKSIKVCDWKNIAQNRDRWKKVVEQARTMYTLKRFVRRIRRRNSGSTSCSDRRFFCSLKNLYSPHSRLVNSC